MRCKLHKSHRSQQTKSRAFRTLYTSRLQNLSSLVSAQELWCLFLRFEKVSQLLFSSSLSYLQHFFRTRQAKCENRSAVPRTKKETEMLHNTRQYKC